MLAWLAGVAILSLAAAWLLTWLRARRREEDVAAWARALREGDFSCRLSRFEDRLSRALTEAAEALEARETRLKDERARLAAAVEGMGEGLLTLDGQQRVVLANGAAARLLELPSDGLAGRALWELVRDEALLRSARDAQATGRGRRVELGPLRERHLTVSLAPSKNGEGPPGLVLVVQDTTESARYVELRKEFVANVSHELRTPLTLIRGFVETLLDGSVDDPAKAREFLEVIDRHARQLSRLVEDLLDLSRLDHAPGAVRRIRVEPAAVAARVVEALRPAARRKGQSLRAEIEPGLPAILGDPDYLERAVSNLVDNAIKYTPEGGSVWVAVRRKGEGVLIEVRDDGIGIPEADLPRIFERFYRVDKSRSRDMGGTGLGLAIVKHVVQAHGGAVEVSSATGQGSSFRILLPLQKA